MTALARIDAEIASLRAKIEGLLFARALVIEAGDDDAKKPEEPAGRIRTPGTKEDERSRQILAILAANGPSNTFTIARAMNLDRSLVRRCLIDHPWFYRLPGKGPQPWQFTEAGRAALV